MSVAIQRKDSGLIWFDAVLNLTRSLSGSVTQHPVEDGSVITDNTSVNNERFTISGVLSDADFNLTRPILNSATTPEVQSKQWINNTPVNEVTFSNVFITDPEANDFTLPEVVSQFLTEQRPLVTVTGATKVKSAVTVAEELMVMFNSREVFDLLDFRDNILVGLYDNCVMTSLSFTEDESSGDAIYPEISIERVKYAISSSIKIDKRSSVASGDKRNKGAQTAETVSTDQNIGVRDNDFSLPDKSSESIKDRSATVRMLED